MASVARTTQTWLQPTLDHSPQNPAGVHTPVVDRAAARRSDRSLYHALCRAAQENEFCLFYQPILDLRSDRIVGAEALLRWQRGTEVICASEFIETLEASDLLDIVSDWTIREACQKAAWINRALAQDFRIAVNVAPQPWT